MSLITGEELARGLLIGIFGGAAGLCTVALPGSALWLLPAGIAVGGCALTVPEVRQEVTRALPALPVPPRLRALPDLLRRPSAALARLTGPGTASTPKPSAVTGTAPQPTPAADDDLVETLAGTPHRLIIGHTRGGKTTLIHHMATEWAAQGERVLVGDPDAAPGLWPGCEVRGYGDDINAIGELLTIVQAEVIQRRAARAQGVRRFAPLHLIIDEAQDVLPALDGGLELFEDVARRGGKLNIRMTVGVQDKQVRTLGLEGKSELLRNFQVADVLKSRDGRRVAVLRDAETNQRVTMPIPALTDPETLIITPPAPQAAPAAPRRAETGTTITNAPAVSRAVPVSADEADDLLASLMAEIAPSASGQPNNTTGVTVTVTDSAGNGHGNNPASAQITTAGNGPGVTIYAQAYAPAASAPGRNRARRERGLDMRRRHKKSQAARARTELAEAYAAARAGGVPSFRAAYRDLGGNRAEALAAWQAAKGAR
jgi:hypothetical protein